MDFIFSSDQSHVGVIRSRIIDIDAHESSRLEVTSGAWGTCVATGSQYAFGAMDSESHLLMVLGDPLGNRSGRREGGVRGSSLEAYPQSRLQEFLVDGGMEHPSAIVQISKSTGSIDVVTDVYLGVPIFLRVDRGVVMLASSPDLLAAILPTSFDADSAIERLSMGVISSPHTLYREIKALSPASVIRIEADGTVRDRKWWQPPFPDESADVADFREELHSSVLSTLCRIASSHPGQSGAFTLSAGLDSRFMVMMALKEQVCDFTAVNLALGTNIPARTAVHVARRAHVPLISMQRPTDFYSRLLLQGHPEIGTNACIADAHFADRALGDLEGAHWLVGGYSADVMLKGSSTSGRYAAVREVVRTGEPLPRLATGPQLIDITPTIASMLDSRQTQARRSLGMSEHHSSLADHVSLHRASFGHFAAATRNYAVYEPFMTRRLIELSYRIPDAVKTRVLKSHWYQPYLDGQETGRLFSTRVKAERRLRRATGTGLKQQGEWSQSEGPLWQECLVAAESARFRLSGELGLEITMKRKRLPMALTLSTAQALQRCT